MREHGGMVLKKNKIPFSEPAANIAIDNNRKPSRKKTLLALGLGVVLLFVSVQLPDDLWAGLLSGSNLRADMTGFASLGCAYLLAILLLAPLSPFALTAGLLFGFWWGSLLALLALNAGAALAFLIPRYLLPKQWAHRLQYGGGLAIVARALAGNGIATIAMLRLNPVVPFNLQNYVCGASGVNFARYSLGTFIGATPFTIALVYLGHAGRRLFLATGLQVEQWSLLIFLSAAVLTMPITISVLRENLKRLRECRNDETTTDKN